MFCNDSNLNLLVTSENKVIDVNRTSKVDSIRFLFPVGNTSKIESSSWTPNRHFIDIDSRWSKLKFRLLCYIKLSFIFSESSQNFKTQTSHTPIYYYSLIIIRERCPDGRIILLHLLHANNVSIKNLSLRQINVKTTSRHLPLISISLQSKPLLNRPMYNMTLPY